MNKILKDYINYKKVTVKSTEKLNNYKRYVKDTKTENELIKYINSLQDFSINTINDIKALQKNFIKWRYRDWSSKFPNLDRICRTQKAPSPQSAEDMLSLNDVEKLINGEKDLMWKCYWLVFFYGGCRPSEACKLTWNNVFFEPKGTIIKIFSKKNNKTFYKSIPDNVTPYLKEWRKLNESDFVFPSPLFEGKHIVNKSVYHRLKNLSKRVLGKHIYPYTLRRSIATIKYTEDGAVEDDIAQQMGHTKSMKHVYVKLNGEQIKDRARKIWKKTKKLTPEEQDRLVELEKRNEELEKKFDKEIGKANYKADRAKDVFNCIIGVQQGLITKRQALMKIKEINEDSRIILGEEMVALKT